MGVSSLAMYGSVEMTDTFFALQILLFCVSEEITENVPQLQILLPLTDILETYVYLF